MTSRPAVALLLAFLACFSSISCSPGGGITVALVADRDVAADPEWPDGYAALAGRALEAFERRTSIRLKTSAPLTLPEAEYTPALLREHVAKLAPDIYIVLTNPGRRGLQPYANLFDNLAVLSPGKAEFEQRLTAALDVLFATAQKQSLPASAAKTRAGFPFHGGLQSWSPEKQRAGEAVLETEGLSRGQAALEIALAHSRGGYPDLAIDGLQRILTDKLPVPGVQSRLGALLARKGQREKAETALRAALAENPADAAAHMNFAVLIVNEIGRHPEALTHLREAVRLEPSNEPARHNLASAEKTGKLYEAARTRWAGEFARNPASVESHIQLAHALARLGELEDAARHYRAILAAHPDRHALYSNLATVLYQAGDRAGYEAAKREMEATLR